MFLFTHVEKCGGTTFSDMLSLTFPRYLRITKNNYGGNDSRNDLKPEELKKLMKYFPSGIGGHCVRPHLDYFDAKATKITFLRNPIARYMSHMNHIIESGWATSVDDFLSKEKYRNFITKKMAGTNDFNSANRLLSGFDFIGDVDQFNQSLNALQEVLNVKFYGDKIIKNERKKNKDYVFFEDLSSQQKLIVEEGNKNDILLYEKYILNSTYLSNYSDSIQLKEPSELRIKLIRKLNAYKKKKIVNPIRSIDG